MFFLFFCDRCFPAVGTMDYDDKWDDAFTAEERTCGVGGGGKG